MLCSMKKYLKVILISLSLFSCSSLVAQTILTDENGKTSISLIPEKEKKDSIDFDLGQIVFSTKDKRLGLNFFSYFTSANGQHFFTRISANSKIKNSTANVFESGDITGESNVKLAFGYQLFRSLMNYETEAKKRYNRGYDFLSRDERQDLLDNATRPANDMWIVFNADLTGSSFKLYYPDSTFDSQIQKQKFTGYEFSIGLNYWSANILDCSVIFGGTIGVKQKSNFDDLTEGIREDNTVSTDSIATTRKVQIKETVYTGNYKESIIYPLNLDAFFVPHNLENIGFSIFSRTEISKSQKPTTNLGIGIFFLKDRFNPKYGITMSYGDVFDVDNGMKNLSAANRISVALTTSFNLFNRFK